MNVPSLQRFAAAAFVALASVAFLAAPAQAQSDQQKLVNRLEQDAVELPARSGHDVAAEQHRPRQGRADRSADRQGRLHLRRLGRPRGAARARPGHRQVGRAGVLHDGHGERRLPGRRRRLRKRHAGHDRKGAQFAAVQLGQGWAATPASRPARSVPAPSRTSLPTWSRSAAPKGVYGGLNLDGTVIALIERLEQGVLRQGSAAAGHPDPHVPCTTSRPTRCWLR